MKEKLIKGTVFISASSIIFMITSYIANIWLGRYLGPKDYGTYGIIVAVISIVNIIQTAGIPQSVSKLIAQNDDEKEPIFRTGLLLQIVLAVLFSICLIVLAVPLSKLLNDNSLANHFFVISIVFPFFGIYAMYNGFYNGLHNFGKQSLITSVYSISRSVLSILLVILNGITGTIFAFILSPVIALLGIKKGPRFFGNMIKVKRVLNPAIPLAGFALFLTLQQTIDLYFVKSMLENPESSGFYTAAQNVSKIFYVGLSGFSIIVFPSLSSTLSKNLHQQSQMIIKKGMRFILILLMPLTLLLSLYSGEVLELLYSAKYLPGSQSLSILSVNFAFLTIFVIYSNILSSASKLYLPFILSIIGTVITSILCIMLIPYLKLTGAAYSVLAGSLFSTIFAIFYTYKYLHVVIDVMSTLRIIGATILSYFIWIYLDYFELNFILTSIILLAFYFIMLVVSKEFKISELSEFTSLLNSK